MLTQGSEMPEFALMNHNGERVESTTFRGRRRFVYWYPRAGTPGCTQQACLLQETIDAEPAVIGDVAIIGISPDAPAALARFAVKYGLGFTLLSDPDHAVAEAFGVWQEKRLYGKTSMGIVRSAFLVGIDGRIEQAWYKISPKDTPTALLEALRS